jgi:hypothetical protein
MTNALVEAAKSTEMLTAAEVRARVNRLQEIMQAVMKKDVHFGVIPGTEKPTLYKPGAEKVLMTFRIAAVLKLTEDLGVPGEEARYRITMQGVNQGTGEILGEGIGECSSNEEKYKWRRPVHENEFNAAPEDRRRVKYQRNGDTWNQVRVEPSDVANTVLKMASKRAMVAMTLVVTAASDVFSQDIEDLPEELREIVADDRKPEPASVRRGQTSAAAGAAGPLPDGVVRLVGKVEEKKGTGKGGKAYTKYTATDSRGVKYSTFSDSLAKLAAQCIQARTPVQLTYQEGEYGNDLKEIKVWEPPVTKTEEPKADAPKSETAAATDTTAQQGLPVDREPGSDDE